MGGWFGDLSWRARWVVVGGLCTLRAGVGEYSMGIRYRYDEEFHVEEFLSLDAGHLPLDDHSDIEGNLK